MVRRRPVLCLLGRWRGRYWAWSIFRLMFSILTWMELKGWESQGLGDPKWGRLHTRDHEGTAKGREPRAVLAAFAGRWAPRSARVRRPPFHHVGRWVLPRAGQGGMSGQTDVAGARKRHPACRSPRSACRAVAARSSQRPAGPRPDAEKRAELHRPGLRATRLDAAGP